MKKRISNPKLISHILLLALVLSIAVVATFSWYSRSNPDTPSPGEGNKFTYTQSGNVNGSGGTVATYAGKNDNGVITYSTESVSVTGAVPTEPGALSYFKTVVTDESSNGDSLISVYLENFAYSSSMGDAIHIGLTEPEKTYKPITATLSGDNYVVKSVCLEDNVFIKKGGTVEIYWFVEIDANYSGNGSIDLGNLHLVYN